MAKIREARAEDGTAIAAVHVATWLDAYAGIIPDEVLLSLSERDEARYWHRALASTGGGVPVLVAEADGKRIIAYASAGRSRNLGLPYDGEVYTLYVLPDHQGQGVGRQILSALFARMVAGGFRSAVIWVLAENPSRFFYRAMGGASVAQRTERFRGTMLDEIAFGWSDLQEAVAMTGRAAMG